MPIRKFRLVAAGDVALNGGYEVLARQGDPQRVFADIAPRLQGADIAIGNLEGPLTQRPGVSPPWRYCLRGHPSYAPILRAAGFRVLSLANNHIMDYGWEAAEETLSRLAEAGILAVGAGRDLAESRRPVQVSVNGVRVGFLGYCAVSVGVPIYAGEQRPGVAPAREEYLLEDIPAAKRGCDFLVVSMHWGQEHVGYPTPRQRRLARQILAAGANLICGHHPHVLQGVERWAGGLVAYSLGNLTFSEEEWLGKDGGGNSFRVQYMLNEAARRTALWSVDVAPDASILAQELIPFYLGPDLSPIADLRPQRHGEISERDAALQSPVYRLRWAVRMVRSRIRTQVEGLFPPGTFWKRIRKLRPSHLRQMARLLAEERRQLRGSG